MKDKIDAHFRNDVYTTVSIENGQQLVKNKWVYALKKNPDGTTKFKA
jgi:hypothetical protein